VATARSSRPRCPGTSSRTAILDLVTAGHVVIAGGGGGIPTVRKDDWYKAIDAVIDKDYVSVMLAADTGCNALAILTGVEKVAHRLQPAQ